MEPTYIYEIIENISWAGVIAMAIYFVIRPLVMIVINKINGVSTDVAKEVRHISGNHLTDVGRRLEMLEQNDIRIFQAIDGVKNELSCLRERMARIEAKINLM